MILKINELSCVDDQLREFIRLIPAAVAVLDNEMRYLAVSDRWLSEHRIKNEFQDVIGLSHYDVFPDISEHWKELHHRCLAGETLKKEEDTFEWPDGSIDWLRWEMVPWTCPDGNVRGMILFTDFITEEKQAAQILIDEKDRAKRYLAVSGTMIMTLNIAGRITQINESGCQVLGCGRSEVIGRDWFRTFIPVEDQTDSRSRFDDMIFRGNDQIEQLESRIASRGGVIRIIAWRASITKDGDGKSTGVLFSGEDITEKREWEHNSLIMSHRNQTILNAAGDGIYGVDLNGLATFINPAAARMLGYEAGELIGQPLHDLIHHTRQDGSRYLSKECPINKCSHSGISQTVTDDVLWCRDGSFFPVEYTATPVEDDGEVNGAVVVFRDVTKQQTLQAKLIQSSKMATLGEMATGVAHELNQPLNVIRMASENISRKLRKGEVDVDYVLGKLDRINAQTERASAIIDHMRIFGRPAETETSALHIPDVVENALSLIGEQLRLSNISITTDIDESCGPVMGHEVQVEQVFLNLLTNARDALQENRPDDNREIRIAVTAVTDKDVVRVTVSDSAGGIDPNILNRIFDPFYTTKEVGKGTGLGLSISYGIVIDMGGTIVAGNDEQGACFTIEWPVVRLS